MPKTKVMIKTLRGKDEYKKEIWRKKSKKNIIFCYTGNEWIIHKLLLLIWV